MSKLPSSVQAKIYLVSSDFWDILKSACSKDDKKEDFKKLKHRISDANLFNLKFAFFTIIEGSTYVPVIIMLKIINI